MANVFNDATKQYLTSVDTPQWIGKANCYINPVMPEGIRPRLCKWDADLGQVREMTSGEKSAVTRAFNIARQAAKPLFIKEYENEYLAICVDAGLEVVKPLEDVVAAVEAWAVVNRALFLNNMVDVSDIPNGGHVLD